MPLPELYTLEDTLLQRQAEDDDGKGVIWLARSPPVGPLPPTKGAPGVAAPSKSRATPTTATTMTIKASAGSPPSGAPGSGRGRGPAAKGSSSSSRPCAAVQGGARPKTYTGRTAPSPVQMTPRGKQQQQQQWGQYDAPFSQMTWGQTASPGGLVMWGQCAAPGSSLAWEQQDCYARGAARPPPAGRSGAPRTPPARSPPSPPHVVWCGPARPPSKRGGPTPSRTAPIASPQYYEPRGLDSTAPPYNPTPVRQKAREVARRRREEMAAQAEPALLPSFRVVPVKPGVTGGPAAKRGKREHRKGRGAGGKKEK